LSDSLELEALRHMYQISQLPNGVTVVTADMPHMSSVSLGLWVNVGGRHEPAALSGASHFIEHMLFKGTRSRSARQISQDVEGVGGYLNAFTTEETTCFYAKACHDRVELLMDVLMDMFLHSRFDPGELEKERNVIREELAMYLDQPAQHVQELLNDALWPNHPLGRSITGTRETLDALGREDLLRYRDNSYRSKSIVVAAAGRLRHQAVVRLAAGHLRALPAQDRPTFEPAPVGPTPRHFHVHRKATEQSQLAMGFRACSRHDDRRFPLRLLNTMLGENMSSRLFQVVREEHGLAYSVSSGLSLFEDAGVLGISAGLETERLEAAVRLILREVGRFAERLVSLSELRRAKDYVIGQMDLSLENTESHMIYTAEQTLGYGQPADVTALKERIRRVTPAEVRAVARVFLRPERRSVALITPVRRLPALRRLCEPG
jgi:predicted Zn-dependent peptidase